MRIGEALGVEVDASQNVVGADVLGVHLEAVENQPLRLGVIARLAVGVRQVGEYQTLRVLSLALLELIDLLLDVVVRRHIVYSLGRMSSPVEEAGGLCKYICVNALVSTSPAPSSPPAGLPPGTRRRAVASGIFGAAE